MRFVVCFQYLKIDNELHKDYFYTMSKELILMKKVREYYHNRPGQINE